MRRFIKLLKGPADLPRPAPSLGSEPSAQPVLLYLLLQSSLVLLEVLEHLLVHASLEMLSAVGDAELAVQLEVQLLHNLPELRAWRPYRRLRHLRAWPCRKVEVIR